MKELFESVKEFHLMVGQPVIDKPTIPSKERGSLRYDLIAEEVDEFYEAMEAGDIVEVMDAMCDIFYIGTGTCLEYGFTEELFMKCFREVQRSNMSKSCSTQDQALEEVDRLVDEGKNVTIEERNGRYILINADTGKILKPSTYSKPDLKQFFA